MSDTPKKFGFFFSKEMVEAGTGEPCSAEQWDAIAPVIYDTLEYSFTTNLEDLDGDSSRFEDSEEFDSSEPESITEIPENCEGYLFGKEDVESILGSEVSDDVFFAIANSLISDFEHQFQEECRTMWPEIDNLVADRKGS
jgi:hypothetical protein